MAVATRPCVVNCQKLTGDPVRAAIPVTTTLAPAATAVALPPRSAPRANAPPGATLNPVTKAYWINVFRTVHDQDKLAAYIELAGPAMESSGGRFLARGTAAHAFESGVLGRTTLIEFDSVEAAVAAYESPGYQAALRALGDGAERDIRIIEALD